MPEFLLAESATEVGTDEGGVNGIVTSLFETSDTLRFGFPLDDGTTLKLVATCQHTRDYGNI